MRGFLDNFFDTRTTEEVVREGIRATRYDWQKLSRPLDGEKSEMHAQWLAAFKQLDLV